MVAGTVLGFGIACLLGARFGADGYSMLNDGVATALDAEFLLVNVAISAAFVAVGWIAGQVPGIGTIGIPLVVGAAVSLFERVVPEPDAMAARIGLFVGGFALMVLAVAAYLGTNLGVGPAEAPPLAFDERVPFRWSYGAVQVGGALIGWMLGSPIGAGTVAVVVLIGPLVDRARPWFDLGDGAATKSAADVRPAVSQPVVPSLCGPCAGD